MTVAHLTPDTLAARPAAPGRQGDRRVHPRAAARARSRRPTGLDADLAAPGDTTYSFTARRLRARPLGRSTPTACAGTSTDEPAELDAQAFVVEFAERARASPTRCCRPTSRSWPARSPARRGSCDHRTVDRRPSWSTRTTRPIEAGDDRGPPRVRRQQRPDRLRRSTTTRRTPPRPAARSGWSGWPPAASTPGCRWARGLDEDELYAGELDEATPRTASRSGCPTSASTRPTTCCLPRAPVAVAQQDRDHVRPRPRPPRPGAASARAPDELPRPAVDPDVLQRQPSRSGTT